jgi:hypothetical protein
VTEPPPGPGNDPPAAADNTDDTDGTAPEKAGHGSEEEIDESIDESFPASDAPQWWSGEPDDDDA